MNVREHTDWNYSYIQILLESEKRVESLQENLKNEQIAIRRYFFPSLNTLKYIEGNTCEIAEDISERIMTLPGFYNLDKSVIKRIINRIQ
jgi:dTDP-4-amino-4,6-dideoxygalactose transaminase